MAYQKILVAIDDSEISANVIQQAAQLAKALNSQITLVQVVTLDPYLADAYLRMGQSNELIERVRSYVQENLTKAQKQFEAALQNPNTKADAYLGLGMISWYDEQRDKGFDYMVKFYESSPNPCP